MILFFDTETTGLPNSAPIDHPSQPRIVQIAAQLCDNENRPLAGFSLVVDPQMEIPERAAAVHGITTETAVRLGMSIEFALSAFAHLYQRAELVVAHNIKFDKFIVEAAIARHYGKPKPLTKPLFCTMDAALPVVNMPPTERMRAAGFTKPKPPKLAECIKHFFDEDLIDAHDAMIDLQACRRIYFHLKSLRAEA